MKRRLFVLAGIMCVLGALVFEGMTATLTKRLIGKQDFSYWDGGATDTFTAVTSTGRTMTLSDVDWMGVDVEGIWKARNQTALDAALTAIGTTRKARMWLAPGEWVLGSDTTVTSNITLAIPPGAYITLGTYDLTINGKLSDPNESHYRFNQASTGKVTFGSGAVPYTRPEWWGPNTTPGTTDMTDEWQNAINAAYSSGMGPRAVVGISGTNYLISSDLVLPTPASSTARLDFSISGDGGITTLTSSGAIDMIRTYDESSNFYDGSIYWSRGLTFRDLYLDGASGIGTNGLKILSGCQNVLIDNCVIEGFSNANIYLLRCLETTIRDCYLLGESSGVDNFTTSYGLYSADGSTLELDGDTIRIVEVGIQLDGNETEAASGNDDGTDDVKIVGNTVIEDSGKHAIHLAAGKRFYCGPRTHIEDIGYNYSGTAVAVKVSNEGGQNPENAVFDRVSATTNGAADDWFSLENCSKTQFIHCLDGGLKGGTIAATASNTLITAGQKANDFRPFPASNITNNSTTTLFTDKTTGEFIVYGYTTGVDNYTKIQPSDGYVYTARGASGNVSRQLRTSTAGTVCSQPYLQEKVIGQLEIGDGTNPFDVALRIRRTVTTSNDTYTNLWSLTLDDESVYQVRAWVVGNQANGSEQAAYGKTICVYRDGGGSASYCNGTGDVDWYTDSESDATWDCLFNVTSNNVQLRVKGAAANDVDWLGVIEYMRVTP